MDLDLHRVAASFDWLLSSLGWTGTADTSWPEGRIWRHENGVYVVLEQSPDVTGTHDRHRAGLNHLALRIEGRDRLDALRQECGDHGWSELFSDHYPHAGGPDHTALFIQNAEGFEFEIVCN